MRKTLESQFQYFYKQYSHKKNYVYETKVFNLLKYAKFRNRLPYKQNYHKEIQ